MPSDSPGDDQLLILRDAASDPARLSYDARVIAEILANVLVERRLPVRTQAAPISRVLDASQVADLFGRDRHKVYSHTEELGASG